MSTGDPELVFDSQLGAGTFGQVWLATVRTANGHPNLRAGQAVAVKTMKGGNAQQISDVKKEIDTLQRLHHPNCVQYLGCVNTRHGMGILLEYCDRGSLRALYEEQGALSDEMVRTFLAALLQGLGYLHGKSFAHRDIKSANVLLKGDGTCKLGDFGEAEELRGESGLCCGTYDFMAPEVHEGRGCLASDIWSLGATVWELLLGTLPFPQMGQARSHMFQFAQCFDRATSDEELVPEHPNLCPEALNFVRRCIRRKPNDRPTVFELMKDPYVNGFIDGGADGPQNFRPVRAATTPSGPVVVPAPPLPPDEAEAPPDQVQAAEARNAAADGPQNFRRAEICNARGNAAMVANRHADACGHYLAAILYAPRLAEYHDNLAKACIKTEDSQGAAAAAPAALDRLPLELRAVVLEAIDAAVNKRTGAVTAAAAPPPANEPPAQKRQRLRAEAEMKLQMSLAGEQNQLSGGA
jgi:hypothetical protein